MHIATKNGHFEFIKFVLEKNFEFPNVEKFRNDLVFSLGNNSKEKTCLSIAIKKFGSKNKENYQKIGNYLFTKYYHMDSMFKVYLLNIAGVN